MAFASNIRRTPSFPPPRRRLLEFSAIKTGPEPPRSMSSISSVVHQSLGRTDPSGERSWLPLDKCVGSIFTTDSPKYILGTGLFIRQLKAFGFIAVLIPVGQP